MIATGVLPKIAGLDTPLSVFRALLPHLLVSALIGMTFGLLSRGESLPSRIRRRCGNGSLTMKSGGIWGR